MFGFLFRSAEEKKTASLLYNVIIQQSRKPVFYKKLKVPDTVDGRFDMILIHAFMVHARLIQEEKPGAKYSQILFDYLFREMDRTLREMGIGDLAVPKHMKRMMKAYKGRLVSYSAGFYDRDTMKENLKRNLYRKTDVPDDEILNILTDYIVNSHALLTDISWRDLCDGKVEFAEIKNDGKRNTDDATRMVA